MAIPVDETLHQLSNALLNRVTKVRELPSGIRMCLGAFSPTLVPSKEEEFIILHLRPHAVIKQVTLVNDLHTILQDAENNELPGITITCTRAFAFLECICRHLKKGTVYWKTIDPRTGSYEVYV